MRIIIGFLIGLLIAGAIAATAVKVAWGDVTDISERDRSKDETRKIEAADFDRIEVAGVFELDVVVGGDYALTLSGRPVDLDRTSVRVEGGVLSLETGERGEDGKRRLVKHGVSAVISLPSLKGVDASGVVDGKATGIVADNFSVDISGVGELTLAGSCGSLTADVSGVGELSAAGLQCRTVDVDVSGVGEATVYASESVDADIAGVGEIEILGSPSQVSKSATPFGRISIR